jgi:peptidoglycan-N-acetylglucosamine deacetylase
MSISGRVNSRFRDMQDFQELGGPVIRTHPILERIFPTVIWRYPSDAFDSPIHLTFDDGPSDDGTLHILEVLNRHDVQATFFVTGSELYNRQDIIRQIQSEGHRVGYHGLTHESWWMRAGFRRDLEMNPDRIPVLEENPFMNVDDTLLLRAPFGRIDFATLNTAKELNATLVHWSLTVRDWMDNLSASTLSRVLYRFTHPGDILLLHDAGPSVRQMAKALDTVIPEWKESGMNISSIDPFLTVAGK